MNKLEALTKINELQEFVENIGNPKPWPQYGDEYEYINNDVYFSIYINNKIDVTRKSTGNIFKVGEGRTHLKWRKLHQSMLNADDGWKDGVASYYLTWDTGIMYVSRYVCKAPNTPYFDSECKAKKAAEEILGDDAEFYLTYDGVRYE